MKKLKRVELKNGDSKPFVLLTKKWGRAEFILCPVWRRGRLSELFISPEMQEDMVTYHVKVEEGARNLSVMSWQHKGFGLPRIWLSFWCETHKCMGFRVYPPDDTNRFRVDFGTNMRVIFEGDE